MFMKLFPLSSQVVTQKKNEEAPKGALTVGLDEGFAEKKSRRVSPQLSAVRIIPSLLCFSNQCEVGNWIYSPFQDESDKYYQESIK